MVTFHIKKFSMEHAECTQCIGMGTTVTCNWTWSVFYTTVQQPFSLNPLETFLQYSIALHIYIYVYHEYNMYIFCFIYCCNMHMYIIWPDHADTSMCPLMKLVTVVVFTSPGMFDSYGRWPAPGGIQKASWSEPATNQDKQIWFISIK